MFGMGMGEEWEMAECEMALMLLDAWSRCKAALGAVWRIMLANRFN